jgi:hypothetical protein
MSIASGIANDKLVDLRHKKKLAIQALDFDGVEEYDRTGSRSFERRSRKVQIRSTSLKKPRTLLSSVNFQKPFKK